MPNANYTHTITLYNCLKATDSPDKKDHWYQYVLEGCYYKAAVTRMDSGTNAGMQNVYTVRIPSSADYRPYHEWASLTDEERRQQFTLSLDDIVIHGICLEEISNISGQTSVQVLKRYKPNAFKVTAVSDNTRAMFAKHYRLGG